MELGVRAITSQSWHNQSIRVFFREIQESNPSAGETKLVQLLAMRLSEDKEAADAAAEYIVRNMLNVQRVYAEQQDRKLNRQQLKHRKETIKAAAAQIADQVLLLNMEMPNGKRLRFCTGNYIAKSCGALAKAGKKAGNKMMGQVFDEESLREYLE